MNDRAVHRAARKRRVPFRIALAGLGVYFLSVAFLGLPGVPGLAQAQTDGACSQYSTYTVLGEAEGVQAIVSAPGATLVDTVDADLPGAQASLDSLSGSTGWAGAPFSGTVAGNSAVAGVAANQIPTFAVSSFPAEPTITNSTPASTVQASSTSQSSTAKASAGGPSAAGVTFGQMSASASATCANDGSLHAVADSQTQTFSVQGVFGIGSVTSHASATLDSSGNPTLDGSMVVEGATVLGQQVAITDQGVVLAGTTNPLPANPIQQVLAGAGITVNYIAATKDAKTGQVFAPGLEIIVAENVAGVGIGEPVTTTFELGRAHAVASLSGAAANQASPGDSGGSSGATALPSEPTSSLGGSSAIPASGAAVAAPSGAPVVAPTPLTTGRTPSGRAVAEPARRVTSLIANSSSAGVYGALGAGILLLVLATIVFGIAGVKLQWR